MAHLKKVASGHLAKADSATAGCSGVDPLCSSCNCDTSAQTEFLANAYTVTISGFPAICGTDTFNGAWTLTHIADCSWQFAIDAFHTVTLQFIAASTWRVTWAVTSPGGAFGYFSAAGDIAACTPTAYTYSNDFVFAPFLCFNLSSSIAASGAITVSA